MKVLNFSPELSDLETKRCKLVSDYNLLYTYYLYSNEPIDFEIENQLLDLIAKIRGLTFQITYNISLLDNK